MSHDERVCVNCRTPTEDRSDKDPVLAAVARAPMGPPESPEERATVVEAMRSSEAKVCQECADPKYCPHPCARERTAALRSADATPDPAKKLVTKPCESCGFLTIDVDAPCPKWLCYWCHTVADGKDPKTALNRVAEIIKAENVDFIREDLRRETRESATAPAAATACEHRGAHRELRWIAGLARVERIVWCAECGAFAVQPYGQAIAWQLPQCRESDPLARMKEINANLALVAENSRLRAALTKITNLETDNESWEDAVWSALSIAETALEPLPSSCPATSHEDKENGR